MWTPDRQLTLADGSGWRFRATRDCLSWLDRFASTLSLPVSADASARDLPSVNITSPKGVPEALNACFPADREHVREHALGPLTVYTVSRHPALLLSTPPDTADRNTRLMSLWYSQYPLYPRLLRDGHLPLHAGLALWREQGVLVSAPGGTGKSTTLNRLPEDWRVICDDESWLVATESGLFAHPLPTWSDLVLRGLERSWQTNTAHPVSAIVFLRQAERVKLTRLEHADAAALLTQATEQILRRAWTVLPPPDLAVVRARMFELSERRVRRLRAFILDLNLSDPFAPVLEAALERADQP